MGSRLALIAALLAGSAGGCGRKSCADDGTCVPGQALVGFTDGLDVARVSDINNGIGANILKDLDAGGTGQRREYLVGFTGQSVEDAVAYYDRFAEVKWALPNATVSAGGSFSR